MKRLTGGCHCRNLTYALELPEEVELRFRRCACTFCTKHGSVYTSHPRAALAARVNDRAALSRYAFGTGTAEVHVCARCGAAPWIVSVIEGRTYAVVNANTFDAPPAVEGAPVSSFDAESVEERLARRRRSWIATVELTLGGG